MEASFQSVARLILLVLITYFNFSFYSLADWQPKAINSTDVTFKDGIYTFTIDINAKCNKGRHDDRMSDCLRKSLRSELTEKGKGWPINSKVIFKWSLFVPNNFNFEHHNLMVGQLHIGKSFTEGFRLNSIDGYSYSNSICFGPEQFGKWNNIELKLLLSDQELTFEQRKNKLGKGVFEIWCNERLIYESNGRSNAPKNSYTKFQIGLYLYRFSDVSKPKNNLHIYVRDLKAETW